MNDAPGSLGVTYRSLVVALKPTMTLITRRDWSGAGNIPPAGVGCVVAANHVSEVDPLVVAHFLHDSGRMPRFMAKASLFDVPIAGDLMRQVGQIPVYRESKNATVSLQGAIDAVRAGGCVVVYPEATLTRDPDLWPMRGKSGAARIVLETGCPLVPMAHWGAQRLLPPYGRVVRMFPPTKVTVRAGTPIDTSDLAGPRSAKALRVATERTMDAITGLLEEIRGQTAPAVRFDPAAAGVPATGNPRRH